MWDGKVTEELIRLLDQYAEEHYGMCALSYDDVNYEVIPYDEFVAVIKLALERHCTLIEAIDVMAYGAPREGVDYEGNY